MMNFRVSPELNDTWEPWMGEKSSHQLLYSSPTSRGRALRMHRPPIRASPASKQAKASSAATSGAAEAGVTPGTSSSISDTVNAFFAKHKGLDPTNLTARTPLGLTALQVACKENQLAVMVWLAEQAGGGAGCGGPADGAGRKRRFVSERSHTGQTCLHFAAQKRLLPVMRWLVANGADARAANDEGSRPFHLAAMAGSVEAMEVLLLAGAGRDAAAPDAAGNVPIRWAAEGGHLAAMGWLLRHGGLAVPVGPILEHSGARDEEAEEALSFEVVARALYSTSARDGYCSNPVDVSVDAGAVAMAFGDGACPTRTAAREALRRSCVAALDARDRFVALFLFGATGRSGSTSLAALEALAGPKVCGHRP